MPISERSTRFSLARRASAASAALSLSARSAPSTAMARGRAARIAGGTASRTRSSSESAPRTRSISPTSWMPGPRGRRANSSARGRSGATPVSRVPAAALFSSSVSKLLFLAGGELGVLLGVHQPLQVVGRREPDADQPAVAVRVVVEQLGVVGQGRIDLDDLPGHRSVDLGHRLDRLDGADLLVGVEDLAQLGQLDEHHLAQLLLREVGDAQGADLVLDPDPFVLSGVEVVRGVHAPAPSGVLRTPASSDASDGGFIPAYFARL